MNANVNLVQSQIADIDAALRSLDQQREGLLVIKRAAESVLQPEFQSAGQSGVSTGFRDAIRQALKARPQGMTGKELVQELKASGELSKYRGKVPPSVRVHNELYSMRKGKGEVVRKDKRYRLKDMRS